MSERKMASGRRAKQNRREPIANCQKRKEKKNVCPSMAQGIFSAVLYIAIKYAIRLFRICVRIAFFYRSGNVVNVLVQFFFGFVVHCSAVV